MGLFGEMQARGHEEVVLFSRPEHGLRCIVAIHDTTLGPALGGTRMWPYASEEAAMTDALLLSRAMTYKASLAGLDLGGGKAVIIGDPRTDKTESLLRAYGKAVESLAGRYITAEDVGTTPDDLAVLMQETKWMTGRPIELGGSGDSAPATGFGIYQAMKACAAEVFGDPSLAGRHVAIQGFGKVASNLAKLLAMEEAHLTVAEIDPKAAARAEEEMGASVVAPDQIISTECDVFAPCALGGVLNADTIPQLKCPIVAGGANNQLQHPSDGDRLRERGILYAPDYAINAGGLINLSFELVQYHEEQAMSKVSAIYQTMERIVAMGKRAGISTARAADMLAEKRLAQAGKVVKTSNPATTSI